MTVETAVRIPTILIGVRGSEDRPRTHRPEDYHAEGDGSHDDTEAFLEMMAELGVGENVEGRAGAVYLVDGGAVTLPNTTGTNVPNGMTCRGGLATLKARSAGDFVLASSRWKTPAGGSANSSWDMRGWCIDPAGLTDWGYIDRSYGSNHEGNLFLAGLEGAVLRTRDSKDGTTASAFLSEGRYHRNKFRAGSASVPVLFKTTGTGGGPTDGYFSRNTLDGRDLATVLADFQNAGGWTIDANHSYSSVERDYRLRSLGKLGSVAFNVIEHGMLVEQMGFRPGRIGPGNVHWSDLVVGFDTDDDFELLVVDGDYFVVDKAGTVDARLVHDSDREQKYVYAKGCIFRGDESLVETYPRTPSRITQVLSMGHQGATPMPWQGYPLTTDQAITITDGNLVVNDGIVRVDDGYLQVASLDSNFLGSFTSELVNAYLMVRGLAQAGQTVAGVRFTNRDGSVLYGGVRSDVADATAGSEDSALVGTAITAGAVGQVMYFDGALRSLASSGVKVTSGGPFTVDGYIVVNIPGGIVLKLATVS